MGDITKKRKEYKILEIKEVEDLPPDWKMEINGKVWDFEELAKWGGREKLAYWFSVVFWRSRFTHTDKTRDVYWHAYKKFWKFLEYERLNILKPEEIDSYVCQSFKTWIDNQVLSIKQNDREAGIDAISYGTKRKIFGYIRETIKKLTAINVTKKDLHLPNISYPNSNINSKKTIPYSQTAYYCLKSPLNIAQNSHPIPFESSHSLLYKKATFMNCQKVALSFAGYV